MKTPDETRALHEKFTPQDPEPNGLRAPDDATSVYYNWSLDRHIAVTPRGLVPLAPG